MAPQRRFLCFFNPCLQIINLQKCIIYISFGNLISAEPQMQSSMFRRKLLLLTAALSFLVFIFFSQQVMADMFGWLKKKELQLSPEVNGVVLLNGQAAAGLEITRNLTHGDDTYRDYAIADAEGKFKFAPKKIKVRESMFDTNVSHEIYIKQDENITLLWYAGMLNTMDYDSFNVLLQNMTCELTAPELRYDLKPDPSQPGLYLGVISRCTFVNTDVIENSEING